MTHDPLTALAHVILLATLLLSNQCQAEEDSQQGPSGAGAPTGNDLAKPTAAARQAGSGGMCNSCARNAASKVECMTKDFSGGTDSIECGAGDAESVRCFSLQVYHKGPKDPANDSEDKKKARYEERVERKGCWTAAVNVEDDTKGKRLSCAEKAFQLKIEDGKCVKGDYLWGNYRSYMLCSKTGDSATDEIHSDTEGIKQGHYFGPNGQAEYVTVIICSCKGENCNTEKQEDLDKAVQVPEGSDGSGSGSGGGSGSGDGSGSGSGASLLESFGYSIVIAFSMIVTATSL